MPKLLGRWSHALSRGTTAARRGGDQLKASILFSLKEAFYKAQFPKWRAEGNFRDLALEVDLANGSAKIIEMGSRFKPELLRLRFRFRVVDDYVVSQCWMPGLDVPAS